MRVTLTPTPTVYRLLALALLASCGDTADVFEEPRTVEVAVIPAQWSSNLDLLVVVGDRPGSDAFQSQLGRDLDELIAPLRAAAGATFDLHVGVATTDLGTAALGDPGHPAPAIGSRCAGSGRDGAMLTSSAPVTGPYLIDAFYPSDDNFTGPLGDALEQLVRVGSTGCEYEQPASAAVRALGRDPLAGFRRLPDSNLLVLIATDVDDCSLHDAALLDPARADLGPLSPFRCVQHGLVCDEPLSEPGAKHHCGPALGYLEDVDGVADQLRNLASDPTRVTFGVIAGPREPFEVTPASAIAPACQGPGGSIEPAPRLAALADAFGPRGVAVPACSADFKPALGEVARTAKQMFGVACLDPTVLGDSSTEPGIQPACHATLVAGGVERELPPCPSAGDCFALIADEIACPRSPDYLRLTVGYAARPPADAYVRARCEVPL